MDAVALNDNAVTDTADMLQRQLTLAGGDVEELEEVAAEDAAQSDWAELPDELVEKVLELLQAAGRSEPQDEGLGFFQATATMRLVCAAWKAVHDAMVKRLVLTRKTTDEAMVKLARLFLAVVSLEMKQGGGFGVLTDESMRAVSNLPALTSLDISMCKLVTDDGVRAVSSCTALKTLNLHWCQLVTDAGVRAVSNCSSLTSLNLTGTRVTDEGVRAVRNCTALTFLSLWSAKVTDEGMRAVSSCSSLTSLNLTWCKLVTDVGVRAVSNCSALTSLNLSWCIKVTDVGLRAVSSLPALTFLDLRYCSKVTAAGVQALRNTTAAPSLRIIR
jgi:hypothetical protein